MGQSKTIGEKLNYGQATAEAREWAVVEGKHAEMHLLRQVAILGARAVMECVGIKHGEGVASQDTRGVEVLRVSESIPLHRIAVQGGGNQSARIKESQRSYTIPASESQGLRERLSRRIAGQKLSAETKRSKLQLAIVRQGVEEADAETVMMSHPQLDVRPNMLWTPENMIDHYESQISQLVTFMGEIDDLALQAGAYIYSRHIGEYLEDRQAEA